MKVAVECKSPLMQKSLELFLKNYLSSVKQCDILVRDEKCLNDDRCFYISNDSEADLVKPFSKSQLILALESKYKSIKKNSPIDDEENIAEDEETIGIEILEKRIKFLTSEYQENILKAVRSFYEK